MTLEPDDKACPCCRATMIVIGEDSSERLDKIPAQYRVIVTKRPKLACRACPGTVVQEPAPPRLIEGGIPTEALVAQIVVSRFADHQPLYRQAQMMAREGVIIERSTLSFWIGYAAAEVAPVVDRLREMLLASSRIFADETVIPVLDPGRGRTKKGYFWAIARDDRPWGGSTPPAVVARCSVRAIFLGSPVAGLPPTFQATHACGRVTAWIGLNRGAILDRLRNWGKPD